MLKSELLELTQQEEGAKLEFKRDDVRPETLAKEIVAFANMNGGTILVGVEDNGEISGIKREKFSGVVDGYSYSQVCTSIYTAKL